jgi:metal-responsive CopG/Arc/MetJ family transcriptional regulator
MKQFLIELDEDTAAQLEAVAPARSRRRSEFVRAAIRKALWDLREKAIEAGYARVPDAEPAYFESKVWELRESGKGPAKRPRKTGLR